MSDHPSTEAVRDATIVDPKTRKSFSLKDRDTRGDALFESKKDAKASLEEDALKTNELLDALFACKGGTEAFSVHFWVEGTAPEGLVGRATRSTSAG